MNTKLKVVRIVGSMVTLAIDPSSPIEILTAHISKGAGDKTIEFKFQNPHKVGLGDVLELSIVAGSSADSTPVIPSYTEKTNLGNIGALTPPVAKVGTGGLTELSKTTPPTKTPAQIEAETEHKKARQALEAKLAEETAAAAADKKKLDELPKDTTVVVKTDEPGLDDSKTVDVPPVTPIVNNNPQPGSTKNP